MYTADLKAKFKEGRNLLLEDQIAMKEKNFIKRQGVIRIFTVLLVLVLALALTVVFAACGKKKKPNNGNLGMCFTAFPFFG